MKDINDADQVRAEFLKRFDGPNGKCRRCGARPDPKGDKLTRAIWYAEHKCSAESSDEPG